MARLLALLLALPGFALAAEPADKAATPMAGSDVAGQLGQLLLGLLLVIGLIFVLAWLLRRVQQLAPRSGQVIKLLATQPLGPRDRLVLVQVGNEQILLGLSAGRIAPLHVLKEPVHLSDAEPATPEFAQRLMELLGKDQKDKS
ncbi:MULTISPECIES: flagellar biosynthetic protein FliO [Pseudomonadaceae]|jgi:flagellar protein FliO/FliZ|uniref:Flagellar protein n=3 Tax=Pseudomonadaceae TaxID=135621 RepID=A0A061CVG3_ECTOL|nr:MULTISPECIES: flagellar biosynthetic protein FliO [Pseudomonas]ATH81736.1 flagellar biosynthetic protein FliO [Pseudomonas mendocina]MDH0622768.1 flagellar biosynthetic protein FliO [Pseudomonas chengduensis]MDH1281105.1 flagellar biosynthetic protein FliO [Pseudomonas chengduensis]MDH1340828.1 flagellar biosynthetic protein FliO [Pseudomonas oleovorans]MDH1493450.1 flagellar biosynthetic protein FliO [Pseudomonas oleovorans]